MAVAKHITSKIKSVNNTKKITKAMEMVAASKMRRAQELMATSRPYARSIRKVIGHIALGSLEYKHPYIEEREVKRVGYIVISSDRGLCGGLNINLFRKTISEMKAWREQEIEIDVATIGAKGLSFFSSVGSTIVAQQSGLGDQPELRELVGTVRVMLDAYDEGRLDRLFLVNNNFVNTMTQEPVVEQLLPLPPSDDDDLKHRWDYIYEPDAQSLLDTLMSRYIESQVYQGVVENLACEMSARMVAMRAATDNATSLIEDLELAFNKARQAAITQELSEIAGGAAAV